MEGIFEAQSGVTAAVSGYAGGVQEDANYELVSAGNTDHREAVEISYDPAVISYATLVDLYFTQIDPTQADGQFGDLWYRYTTAILYSTDAEKKIATTAIGQLEASKKFDKPIAVKVEPRTTFFPAEEYHQDYYKKSAFRYSLYKEGSGRKGYIEQTWDEKIAEIEAWQSGKTQKPVNLKNKLTDIQYRVTQEEGTEAPFKNPYWDNHESGIYVDIVDGSPLFASLDKFDSGTGWPSFTRVMTGASIVEKTDTQLFSTRTEVRSKNADSHLGHLFSDGPVDQWGMRYCINSAALRFVPVADLDKEWYGEYLLYFDKQK
jgi:peptide methionine sulfoxide reductase msrA/msrB